MRCLVDTNVLLRWSDADHPLHSQCVGAVDRLVDQGYCVCTCAQVLIEYWAVATRPREVNGLGLAVEGIERNLTDIDQIFLCLPEPPDIAVRWHKLAVSKRVLGRQAHDARIAAFMLAHGISHILTLNACDFTRYQGIVPVSPSDVL